MQIDPHQNYNQPQQNPQVQPTPQQMPYNTAGNPQMPYGNPQMPNYPQQPYYEKPKGSNGVGIAAFVCGLLALILGAIPLFGFMAGTPLGIAAIILAIIALAKNSGKKTLAIIGLVLALVGIPVYAATSYFASVAIIEESGGNVSNLVAAVENANGNLSEDEMEDALFGDNVNEYRNMKNEANKN